MKLYVIRFATLRSALLSGIGGNMVFVLAESPEEATAFIHQQDPDLVWELEEEAALGKNGTGPMRVEEIPLDRGILHWERFPTR